MELFFYWKLHGIGPWTRSTGIGSRIHGVLIKCQPLTSRSVAEIKIRRGTFSRPWKSRWTVEILWIHDLIRHVGFMMDVHESIAPNWYARWKQSSGGTPCALTASSPELGGGGTPTCGFRWGGALDEEEPEGNSRRSSWVSWGRWLRMVVVSPLFRVVAHSEGGLWRSSGGGGGQNGFHNVQRRSLTGRQRAGSSGLPWRQRGSSVKKTQ
jgi:hypothetical protein